MCMSDGGLAINVLGTPKWGASRAVPGSSQNVE